MVVPYLVVLGPKTGTSNLTLLWEHSLDHIHELRLADFSLGEIYPEAVPERHDVKLCELIILNKIQ